MWPVYAPAPAALTQQSTPAFVPALVADEQRYAERVQHKHIALDNPAKPSAARAARAARRARQAAEKLPPLDNGVWRLAAHDCRFALFVGLHRLWTAYIAELLGLRPAPPDNVADPRAAPPAAAMHPKLVKADMHGAFLTVKESKNPALVSIAGIVVHETANTFRLLTRDDKLKLIPKRNAIFTLAVPLYAPAQPLPASAETGSPEKEPDLRTVLDAPHLAFALYGNQFAFRAAERAARKFKAKESIEL